jgi:hypothetical protein
MTDPDELGLAVAALADILDALEVRWAVGGSIASAAYGEPRVNGLGRVGLLTAFGGDAPIFLLWLTFPASVLLGWHVRRKLAARRRHAAAQRW